MVSSEYEVVASKRSVLSTKVLRSGARVPDLLRVKVVERSAQRRDHTTGIALGVGTLRDDAVEELAWPV